MKKHLLTKKEYSQAMKMAVLKRFYGYHPYFRLYEFNGLKGDFPTTVYEYFGIKPKSHWYKVGIKKASKVEYK